MDLPDIQKLFLLAAARVSEEDTDRRMEARAVIDRYDFGEDSLDWIFETVRNLGALGFLSPYQRDGDAADQFVHLTAAGVRKARALAEGGLRVFARGEGAGSVPHNDGSFFSDGTGYSTDVPATVSDTSDHQFIDSSTWTGIKRPEVIAGERLVKLRESLMEIEAQVGSLNLASNSDRQQVMAIITAVKVLSDAPDPPSNVIRDLLGIANNIAGVGSLFVAILAIVIAKG